MREGSVAVIQAPVKSVQPIKKPVQPVVQNANIKNEVKKLPTVTRLAGRFKKNGLGVIDSYFNASFFYCQYYKSKNKNGYGKYLALLTFIAKLWGFILDILSPARRLIELTGELPRSIKSSVKNLRALKKKRTSLAVGYIAKKASGYLIPAGAIVFTALTIINISAYKPELELIYNGNPVGFVDSKETVGKVVSLIENNVAAILDENYEFSGDISYRIVFAKEHSYESYISESELYYAIYSSSQTQGEITKAYGLYIDGALIGAIESESDINRVLNEVLEANSGEGDEIVEFANDIKIIPNNYAVRDVVTQDELKNIISYSAENTDDFRSTDADTESDFEILSDESAYGNNSTAESGDILFETEDDIAMAAAAFSLNLTHETINTIPRGFISSTGSDDTKHNQNDILSKLSRASNGLGPSSIQFKKIRTETYTQETPFEIKYIESNQHFTGTQTVRTNGVNGESIITADVTYIGDSEVSREIKEVKIIKEPIAKVVVIGTKAKPATVATGKFIRPVKGGYYTSRFGKGHRGLDIVVPYGTSVMAADGGTVIYSGFSGSYGNHVKIRHSDGYVTLYAHNSSNLVKSGDKVYQGQEIAKAGSTGRSTGNHVHFEISKNGVLLNPESYIK